MSKDSVEVTAEDAPVSVIKLVVLVVMVLVLFFLFTGEPDLWDKLHERAMSAAGADCSGIANK